MSDFHLFTLTQTLIKARIEVGEKVHLVYYTNIEFIKVVGNTCIITRGISLSTTTLVQKCHKYIT